jgi:hypothetical protein
MDSIVFLSHSPPNHQSGLAMYYLLNHSHVQMHSLPWRQQTSQAKFSFNPCSSKQENKQISQLIIAMGMRLGTRKWFTGPSKGTVREHTAWTSLNTLNFEIIGYSSKEKERKKKKFTFCQKFQSSSYVHFNISVR